MKFIFATTEPQNVLPTVLSRCQRFDFHKISSQSIVRTLKKLSGTEKIKIDEEVLYAIARSADGSLRDAEVILEQMNSFSKGKITLDDVNMVLGLISHDAILEISGRLNSEALKDNLLLLDRLISEGKDPAQLVASLIEHFRSLMLVKCGCENLVVMPKDDLEKIKKQSAEFGLENILYCIAVLSQTQQRIKKESLGRLFLEMALVKLARQKELSSNEVLLKKVQVLEQALKNGRAGFSAPAKTVYPSGSSVKNAPVREAKSESEASSQSKPAVEQTKPPKKEKSDEPAQYSSLEEELDQAHPEFNLEQVRKLWPHLVKAIRKEKITLGMYLAEGRVLKVNKNRIEVGYSKEYEFHRESLLQQKNLKFIEDMAEKLFSCKVRLDLISAEFEEDTESLHQEVSAAPEEFPEEQKVETTQIMEEDMDFDDVIQSAIDVFNGRIVQAD